MSSRIVALAWFPSLVLLASPCRAENETCFMGSRDCTSFWITEAGFTPRLSSPPRPGMESFYFHWDAGLMQNLGDWAVGGTVFVGADDDGSRLGCKVRVRRWLAPWVSVDLSPGILLLASDRYGARTPGFTGHVGVNVAEWLQAVAMVEVIDHEPDSMQYPEVEPRTRTDWYAGFKSGGYGGIAGTVVLLTFAVIAAASYTGPFE